MVKVSYPLLTLLIRWWKTRASTKTKEFSSSFRAIAALLNRLPNSSSCLLADGESRSLLISSSLTNLILTHLKSARKLLRYNFKLVSSKLKLKPQIMWIMSQVKVQRSLITKMECHRLRLTALEDTPQEIKNNLKMNFLEAEDPYNLHKRSKRAFPLNWALRMLRLLEMGLTLSAFASLTQISLKL